MTVATLPPTRYLLLEVLAARHRTGKSTWTFPTSCTPTVRALEKAGLVGGKAGVVENTILVWLTDAGRDVMLDGGYVPLADPPPVPDLPVRVRSLDPDGQPDDVQTLTHGEVIRSEFTNVGLFARHGYDENEVDDFLDQVAATIKWYEDTLCTFRPPVGDHDDE